METNIERFAQVAPRVNEDRFAQVNKLIADYRSMIENASTMKARNWEKASMMSSYAKTLANEALNNTRVVSIMSPALLNELRTRRASAANLVADPNLKRQRPVDDSSVLAAKANALRIVDIVEQVRKSAHEVYGTNIDPALEVSEVMKATQEQQIVFYPDRAVREGTIVANITFPRHVSAEMKAAIINHLKQLEF
jgi:hypothetical protein